MAMFDLLRTTLCSCVVFEEATVLRSVTLTSESVAARFASVQAGVAEILSSVPELERTVSGVRTALMGTKQLKQIVEEVVEMSPPEFNATRAGMHELCDDIAGNAAALVMAIRGFGEAQDAAAEAVLCDQARALQLSATALYDHGVVFSICTDVIFFRRATEAALSSDTGARVRSYLEKMLDVLLFVTDVLVLTASEML
eukprot:c46920_g1_i1.p2 GENE.c46920_g1_i1~~c46920_g1_i1.p2  ORF type:complete len:221 (+),score=52.93 c46920_g1_i1:68-664(+)